MKPIFGEQKITRGVWFANNKAESLLPGGAAVDDHGLSRDQIAAVHLYTQNLLYRKLNELLRGANRSALRPFFPFLQLLLTGLSLLPDVPGLVYRGVKADLRETHATGATVTWWHFSSCTLDGAVLQQKAFCGKDGKRTIFAIRNLSGKDVSKYSSFAQEKEVLLLPGRVLKVEGHLQSPGDTDLTIINMMEEQMPFKLVE